MTSPEATSNGSQVELSVIVPICEKRFDDVATVYRAYKAAIQETGKTHEFVYVIDGDYPAAQAAILELKAGGENIRIVKLAKWFGEATALTVGFQHSHGEIIVTLPAYMQIEPADIPAIVASLGENDMAVARRWPRRDAAFNRLQSRLFHFPIRLLTQQEFSDLGCGVRVMRRRILEELSIYGDQHRFLPLLAYQQGFKVIEVNGRQAQSDLQRRSYSIGVYTRRLLDILSVFFLLKFTKKPLRFFGLVGSTVSAVGALTLVYLAIDRLVFSTPLRDRPLLLLASLLLVLGVQIFAIGLVGEIIIFTHAREMKDYTIEEIIN